jgi:hypothetical protein
LLRFRQRDLASADKPVECVFKLILLGGTGTWIIGLGPKVLDGIRATEFQWD